MRDKFIVMNTAIITAAVTTVLSVTLLGSFNSDKQNIEVRKAKVAACATIPGAADRTLCLKVA